MFFCFGYSLLPRSREAFVLFVYSRPTFMSRSLICDLATRDSLLFGCFFDLGGCCMFFCFGCSLLPRNREVFVLFVYNRHTFLSGSFRGELPTQDRPHELLLVSEALSVRSRFIHLFSGMHLDRSMLLQLICVILVRG